MDDQAKQSALDYFRQGFKDSIEKWEQQNKGKETTIELVNKLPEAEKQSLPLHVLMSLGYGEREAQKKEDSQPEKKQEKEAPIQPEKSEPDLERLDEQMKQLGDKLKELYGEERD